MIRLDKYLSDAGCGTRTEVKQLIKNQCVTVNDEICTKPEQKIDALSERVCLYGEPVLCEPYVYIMFHKPAGFITARTDEHHRTVMELLPENLGRNLSPVGRLDKDTEGLLLITNDGALNHHLMSPSHHVKKTYYAVLDCKIPAGSEALFAEGMDIGDDTPTLPAKLTILSSDVPVDEAFTGKGAGHAYLTISEGRYHQVKRMFAAIGCHVVYLKRVALGELKLSDLPRGGYRKLSEAEIALLKK